MSRDSLSTENNIQDKQLIDNQSGSQPGVDAMADTVGIKEADCGYHVFSQQKSHDTYLLELPHW